MNTRPPANDPPDYEQPDSGPRAADEREFARILRALPVGEPSPALDARILGAARDAVATPLPRRRALRWAGASTGAAWGIGSAAAAILAVGIAWRVNAPMEDAAPVPRLVHTSAAPAEEQDSTTVEYVPGAAPYASAPPPPPPPPPIAPKPARRDIAMAPPPPPPSPAAPPAESPAPFVDEHVEIARNRERANADAAGVYGYASGPAPAAAPPEGAPQVGMIARQEVAKAAAPVAEDRLAAGAAAESEVQSSTRLQAPAALHDNVESAAAARERVLVDARRYPESWLVRIRARQREGDITGARASLRLFVERYPQHAVPEELRPLLQP